MPNTVQAAGEAMSSDAIISQYQDLEGYICDAHSAAVVVDDLLGLKFRRRGDRWVADLGPENMDALVFAWKDLRSRTLVVKKKFYAVGAEGQAND